jgi:hypothetical protein
MNLPNLANMEMNVKIIRKEFANFIIEISTQIHMIHLIIQKKSKLIKLSYFC